MDTYIAFLDKYPPTPARRRTDKRLMIGLVGTLLATLICTAGPALSPRASALDGQQAALAPKRLA